MAQHRVNILGASGAGASSLGRALAEALRAPYFDCDDYYHEPSDPPFQRQATPAARHARLVGDLGRQASWVLAGGVAGWEPYPQVDFTQFVFLWVPPAVRIERLRRREQGRFGPRVLPGGDMHAGHEEFIAWAGRYDAGDVEGKTLARHEAYLAQQRCPVLEIRGEVATAEALRRVLAALAEGGVDRDAS